MVCLGFSLQGNAVQEEPWELPPQRALFWDAMWAEHPSGRGVWPLEIKGEPGGK